MERTGSADLTAITETQSAREPATVVQSLSVGRIGFLPRPVQRTHNPHVRHDWMVQLEGMAVSTRHDCV